MSVQLTLDVMKMLNVQILRVILLVPVMIHTLVMDLIIVSVSYYHKDHVRLISLFFQGELVQKLKLIQFEEVYKVISIHYI